MLFAEDKWGWFPPIYTARMPSVWFIFFSLKHKCINGDHSRIIAAQSGSNNHPVGPCGWPCKLKIMLIRGTARRAGKSFEIAVRPLHQWS